ncbi:MAG: 2-oxoglutarate dehydrogenase E1 subunit family protein, partial [Limisphaerales bacterium]
MGQPVRTDLSEVIAENFGANATYVEGLLSRFRSHPEMVDESWRTYFTELLGDGGAAPVAGGGAQPVKTTSEASTPGNGDRATASAASRATVTE